MADTLGATRQLAAWIVDRQRPAPTPGETDIAMLSIVDTLACALAATCEEAPRNLLATRSTGPDKPASVWGYGVNSSVGDAAYVNAMLAHMLDYDDGDMISRMHPSCMLVPAVMAVGEIRGSSGAALVDAYLTGYYVIQAVGRVGGKAIAARGYHVTGMIGALGATAAVARLMELTPDQTANALGIAATSASGLRANFGSDMKPYHAARGALTAIEAVELTQAGITASHDIIEAHDGFLHTLAGPEAAPLFAAEVRRLVEGGYSIATEPPIIKLYACCHAMHACIQVLFSMRPRLIDRLDRIEAILAEAPTMAKMYLIYPEPTSGLQGKFSMEAGLAVALIDGRAGVEQFTDAAILREDVRQLSRKVRFETSERLDPIFAQLSMPGTVTVKVDGEELVGELRDPRGCRSDPCNAQDVLGKLAECATGVIPQADAARLETLLAKFPDLPDVREVSRLLRGSEGPRQPSTSALPAYAKA